MPEKNLKKFLADANLFIAAVKSGWSKSTDLVLKLILDPKIELVANDVLMSEYEKYTEDLDSEDFLNLLKTIVQIENPSAKEVETCKRYLEGEADAVHAATCLKTKAVIITNDEDFDKIRERGIIEVWNISKGIEELL